MKTDKIRRLTLRAGCSANDDNDDPIKEDEMGGICSTHGPIKNICIFVGNVKGRY
jgi:hypothetical protein